MSKTMYWVAEMSTDVSTEFHIESNTNTSLKLDINKIKLTKTILVCLPTIISGQNKSSIHRVRCENILALNAIFTRRLSPTAYLQLQHLTLWLIELHARGR